MLKSRQAWSVALGKFFTDPIWWVYLFWMPDFLSRNLKLDLKGMALPLFVVYSGACVGSVSGGWLSSSLLKKGWSVNASRKTAMSGVCAGGDSDDVGGPDPPCLVCGDPRRFGRGGLKGGPRILYARVRYVSARGAVASVVGFGTLLGSIGGAICRYGVGDILQRTGSYVPIFIIPGTAYLIALGFVQVLTPRLDQRRF